MMYMHRKTVKKICFMVSCLVFDQSARFISLSTTARRQRIVEKLTPEQRNIFQAGQKRFKEKSSALFFQKLSELVASKKMHSLYMMLGRTISLQDYKALEALLKNNHNVTLFVDSKVAAQQHDLLQALGQNNCLVKQIPEERKIVLLSKKDSTPCVVSKELFESALDASDFEPCLKAAAITYLTHQASGQGQLPQQDLALNLVASLKRNEKLDQNYLQTSYLLAGKYRSITVDKNSDLDTWIHDLYDRSDVSF